VARLGRGSCQPPPLQATAVQVHGGPTLLERSRPRHGKDHARTRVLPTWLVLPVVPQGVRPFPIGLVLLLDAAGKVELRLTCPLYRTWGLAGLVRQHEA